MKTNSKIADNEHRLISLDALSRVVAGFRPDEIGLARAWDEFYLACQAANADAELLMAIHDIKESIEDARGVAA